MVFPRVFDSEVEQSVGVLRSVFVNQGVERETGEFEDRQEAGKIETMTTLGKRQGNVDQLTDEVSLGDATTFRESLEALMLIMGDAKTGLDETRHAAVFRQAARSGYRAVRLAQSQFAGNACPRGADMHRCAS
jgi:hypothetical protein